MQGSFRRKYFSPLQPPHLVHPLQVVVVVGDHDNGLALHLVEDDIVEVGVGLYVEAGGGLVH